jgi:hypothetical protein
MRPPQPCRLNGRPRRYEPSDTSFHVRLGSSRNSTTCLAPVPVQSAHVNATDFPEPEVPSTGEARRTSSLARVRSRVRRHHWPVVAAAARVHRGSKTSTRPGYRAPLSRAFRGPHALPRLLQMFCFHEHDHGPLEHPRPPNPWFGTIASSSERNLSIEGDRRRYAGPGVEKEPNLDIPHRDCSRRRLRPNPDRSGHLLSRAPLFALSGKTWGGQRYRQRRACLHRRYDERVVRRLISAKKPDVHQPEGPSIARPSKRTVAALRSAQTVRSTCRRLFHQPRSGRGTLVWVLGGSVIR